MAITIQQQPTTPNMSNNDLLFVLTSNKITEAQYQYVCDIYISGSGTLVQRIQQQPNPNGKGVFNVGNIFTSNLESDNVWKTAGFATSSECNKQFIVKFGESFASSSTTTPILYNGITTLTSGSPAKVGDEWYVITDGLVDYPDAVNFNFVSSSYYTLEPASDYTDFQYQHNLSNAPLTQKVRENDYLTIALYNGDMSYPDSDDVAQDIFYVQIQWYNSAGAVIQNNDFYNIVSNGGAPRTNQPSSWSDAGVYDGQTASSRLLHIGLGPQNLTDFSITPPATWAYYIVNITGQGDDGNENSSGKWATLRFDKQEGECAYNGVRFAWKNEFGVWDYYNFTLQETATNNVERSQYEHTFVPYNTATNNATYDKSRRGATQYVNKVNRVKTANSDWLTQAEADWLKELFSSTNVFIQDGSDFLPAVVSDATLNEKTNPRTQKVFQYTINYALANNLRSRR